MRIYSYALGAVALLAAWLTLAVGARADVRFDLDHLGLPAEAQRAEGYAQVPVTTPAGRAAAASAEEVAAGRYVVRFRLGAPPFGTTAAKVECIVDVPGQPQQRRALYGPDFAPEGAAGSATLEFVAPQPTPVRVYVEWSGNDGKELTWLRVYGVTIATQRDTGLGLARVQASKLLYRPGEAGTVAVTVRNFGAQEQTGTLTLTLTQELSRRQARSGIAVTVPAGEEKTVDLPFTCGAREYGCEAEVTVGEGGIVWDVRSDVFNVADDVWKVSLGASGISIMGMSGYCSPASLENDLRVCRETYSNWWEKMFWPPDDWGDMTPDREEWISGQSARWESAKNLRAFIALARPQGIKAITYGKHGTGGPEGWELTRKHPEWFYTDEQGHISGTFNTWDLANWHDIKLHVDREGRKRFSSDWWGSMPDFRQKEPLEWGIREMIESSKTFGWDGVRFDGHWTAGNDELSTANMKRLKEALWGYDPTYVFGFNQSWSYGLQTSSTAEGMVGGYAHELRESLAGGGMYMQEAINHWAYGPAGTQMYKSWKEYATKEVVAANGVRNLGGAYDFIYGSWGMNPVDRLYKFAMGTAAGIHPVYGDHINMPGCPNWGRFLTRWSAFVWDLNLKPLAAEGAVEVQSARPLWVKEWVKERVADATTRDVIVHLINPPGDDNIGRTTISWPRRPPR